MFRVRPLEEVAAQGNRLDPSARVHHALSLASARVPLAPLSMGATFLDRWPVRSWPGTIDWRSPHYDSTAPAAFVLRDALVHSSAGIIAMDGEVLAETLAHTVPDVNGFCHSGTGIELTGTKVVSLAGRHITVMAGGPGNYFHAAIEAVMRLSMLPRDLLGSADSILYSAGSATQLALLRQMALPPNVQLRPVHDGETLAVETLVLPLSVHHLSAYHPCLLQLYDRMSAHTPKTPGSGPRRLYLDRSQSSRRPLRNEADVIESLKPLGFVAVRLEDMDVAGQIRLCFDAEAIVAPHGAGLTNLGFCNPTCRVLELHMDQYVYWWFRHLAALRGLRYDCVLGRATDEWSGDHALSWHISAQHVAAAAAHMLNE